MALLCLAEALLRIPDADTVDRLIRDKLAGADWQRHLGHSQSLFVNASTWALMLTGRLLRSDPAGHDLGAALRRFVARSGEPVVRQAVTAAMRILGRQFVMGRTIEEALERARPAERHGYRHSYDMLGEAALTAADAARYFAAYENAIAKISAAAAGRPVAEAPGISVKLSALHPRYETAKRERVLREMPPLLLRLAGRAKKAGIGFTIDAEEADRLDLSLDLIEGWRSRPSSRGGTGSVSRSRPIKSARCRLIDWLADLARRGRRRLMVRLVKGAYWDSEIKREPGARARRLSGLYPQARDRRLLPRLRPAAPRRGRRSFTRNSPPTTHIPSAAVLEFAGDAPRLRVPAPARHGRGALRRDRRRRNLSRPCRVYAPVGGHEELLAYLVRRLLENGANTSFVNRIVDDRQPVDEIVADPVAAPCKAAGQSRTRALRCRASSIGRPAGIRAASIWPTRWR